MYTETTRAQTFAHQFKSLDDKASKESGFFFNHWKERLEYHLGPKFIDFVNLNDLDPDPDERFEKWRTRILGLSRYQD